MIYMYMIHSMYIFVYVYNKKIKIKNNFFKNKKIKTCKDKAMQSNAYPTICKGGGVILGSFGEISAPGLARDAKTL